MEHIPKTSKKKVSLIKKVRIIDRYKLDYIIFFIYQFFGLPRFIVYFIINKYKNKKNLDFKNKP